VPGQREIILEHLLTVGHYTVIVETDSYLENISDFAINIFYPSDMELEAFDPETIILTERRHFHDMLCNVAIEKGRRMVMSGDPKGGDVCRYTFKSVTLGLYVVAFANTTENRYSTMRKFLELKDRTIQDYGE
jgi:hypothetical protein